MGKRKRTDNNDNTLPPSDIKPCAQEQALQLEKCSTEQAERNVSQSMPFVKDLTGTCSKISPLNQSTLNKINNSSRTFSRYYSRRRSINATPSTSVPKLTLKLNSKDTTKSSTSSVVLNAVYVDMQKKECGICKKHLKKKTGSVGNYILSVVAVLICGHAFHSDCLEQKTSCENKHDPPCPLCVSFKIG